MFPGTELSVVGVILFGLIALLTLIVACLGGFLVVLLIEAAWVLGEALLRRARGRS